MMTRYDLEFEGRLVNSEQPISAESLEVFTDSVVAELEQLGAEGIDVSVNLENGCVRVGISVESEELPGAQATGSGTIRTAFHAAGVATPEWRVDWVRASTVPEVDLVDA